jgi:hypothetical protein
MLIRSPALVTALEQGLERDEKVQVKTADAGHSLRASQAQRENMVIGCAGDADDARDNTSSQVDNRIAGPAVCLTGKSGGLDGARQR